MKFSLTFQQSYGPWLILKFQFFSMSSEIMNGFDQILFMHWYIVHAVINTHYFLKEELWPLIVFRILFMLSILWNNWWIWNLVGTLIFSIPKHVQQHSGGLSCSAYNAIFLGSGYSARPGHIVPRGYSTRPGQIVARLFSRTRPNSYNALTGYLTGPKNFMLKYLWNFICFPLFDNVFCF